MSAADDTLQKQKALADPRAEVLGMIAQVRDREWGPRPTEAYEEVERVARRQPGRRDGTTARSCYLLRVAAICLAALEQEGVNQMRQEATRR